MKIGADSLPRLYNEILAESNKSESNVVTVLILVANDVDAMASCRILTSLLQNDYVPYQIKPVRGYEDLQDANESFVQTNSELRSIVLLNCGAIVDLRRVFVMRSNLHLYVVDAHRPFHKSNLEDWSNIVILDVDPSNAAAFADDDDDDDHDDDSMATSGSMSMLLEGASSSDDDEDQYSSTDSDEEDMMESEDGLRMENDDDDDDHDDDDDESSQSYGGLTPSGAGVRKGSIWKRSGGGGRRRKRVRVVERDAKSLDEIGGKRLSRRARRFYEKGGSWYGVPTAQVLYMLADKMNKKTNELLWLAIVGLTDQLVHMRVGKQVYDVMAKSLGEEVNLPNEGDEVLLSTDEDLPFMLYQHWNLFDSMYHTRHVASRLKVWQKDGRENLKTLFAVMGIPLQQCLGEYRTMDPQYKRMLGESLQEHAPSFGLRQISYTAFLRQRKNSQRLSATDIVHATSALLECAEGYDEDFWVDNFWVAFDCLKMDKDELLREGLESAKQLQELIVKQACSLIERRVIVRHGPFRYVQMDKDADKFFSHQLTLLKLALFLVDYLSTELNRPPKPFLLSAPSICGTESLIVGVGGQVIRKRGHGEGDNVFGVAFRQAARRMGAAITLHGFESSVVRVARTDTTRFIDYLHAGMVPSLQ